MPNLSLVTALPFVLFLLMIGVMPFIAPHFWEKNKNKAYVAGFVSLPVFVFLAFRFPGELIHTLKDYFSFITLLTSLFIVSGGIYLAGDRRATPAVNTLFLFSGAILANFIGTTGASMVLIRPLLKTNSERKLTVHIPVFFIFIVSNIGGCLTPLADPPLFLGYLKGVPFLWTLKLFPVWLFAVGVLLILFYIIDKYYYAKEQTRDIKFDNASVTPFKVHGKRNILFLGGVVASIFFQVPFLYRELIMIFMIILSMALTDRKYRVMNRFTFAPIIEVAVIFAGIFITMVPLMIFLHEKGAGIGIAKPWQFFWLSGILSSVLDNAPTYLTFFSLAESIAGHAAGVVVAGVGERLLLAISCGAVFMGANTYIGNGPNFMVKAIADEQKFPVPHFFGYMLYSGLILLPLFLIITFIFF